MSRTPALIAAFVIVAAFSGCVPPAPRHRAVCTMPPRAPLPPRTGDPLRGIGDYHAHMFSEQAFGGALFAGKAFVPEPEPAAMAQALAPCTHTSNRHPVTAGVVAGIENEQHASDGYPEFATWPSWNTHTHQQMYVDWVYRAYLYGLRLLVVTATNAEPLCDFTHHPLSCSDHDVARRYRDAVLDMESWVRTHEGGWLEVARSAADARRIIASNRLAIVLAAEMDTLFDCAPGRCSTADVEARLDEYRTWGYRQLSPVHLVDSAFAGSALYDERLSASQYYLRGRYHEIRDCRADGVVWQLRGGRAVPTAAKLLSFFHRGRWYAPDARKLAAVPAHCNAHGLSELGRDLIRLMEARGMLIDLEHMSDAAVADTLAITGTTYPVMLSHTWPRDLKLSREAIHDDPDTRWDEQRAEMHRARATIQAVRASGGVVGVLTNQGEVEQAPGSPVADDCPGSSRSFAQSLSYVAAELGPQSGVGLGTDFNGFPQQPGPRFGADACRGRGAPQDRPVAYDGSVAIDHRRLVRACAGTRAFDFNTAGLAHYGLVPDLVADLRNVGTPPAVEASLFRSAAAYVAMWERAERAAH